MQCNATIQAVQWTMCTHFFFISWLMQNQKNVFQTKFYSCMSTYSRFLHLWNKCTTLTKPQPGLHCVAAVLAHFGLITVTRCSTDRLQQCTVQCQQVWLLVSLSKHCGIMRYTLCVIQVENEHSSIVYCTHLVLVRMGTQIHHLLAKIPTFAPQCISKDGVTTSVQD